ncbi:membrane protein [Sinorhizobium fredii USDA 205]|uniref:BamA/TamA family outer membrane protein n=1 Tax=Rhizobium fredii TaxID=380 RepID=A0A844ADE6_RHIFR|nr:autotransporter assembly complex family protein [Sinorhizobium fredii]AWM26732.1 Outer membrane protein assembly factor YaeT precursor [Sinorhizobium fredii CCBAU 25509]KSV87203.1 membrane protein [Sinorhizobium fredii USDA 205]MQW94330.1 BamA/TamA family outer membrane protein [Sinorhizobium fredii]MQX10547.1 BamA/TamA family outer membrane protein [Sinorhizobium fredii]UTY50788.1 outer membrane protein assembly factor [Sinorhizobium fredii]
MSPPHSSTAYWKAATALALAASTALGPIFVGQAHAIRIFGMRFFESAEEQVQVLDPVNYTLTFEPGTDDEELREALENASQLNQDQEKPVSGDLGLLIKARDDRERLLAALYEKARYGGTITILINGQDIDSLPPDPSFPDGQAVPVTVRVAPGPAFTLDAIKFEGDAAGLDPATYDLTRGARADSTLIIKAGEQIVVDLKEQSRPLAKIAERSVVADHATSTVDVTIRAESGPVAPVGDLTVTGTKTVDPNFVRDYSRLNHGRPYSPENIRKAAERLRTLNVFSSVTIVEADQLAPDGTIPMNIQVSEGKHRYFGFGGQVSTTDGLGLQGYWGHRNLFGRAESLRIEGSVDRIGETTDVGGLDYSAGILFAKPGAFGPASTFTASVKAAIVDPDAYNAKTITAAAGAAFELTPEDTVSVGAELGWADIDDAFGSNSYLTAAIPLEYVRDTRDDKLNATEGYRAMINAKPSYEIEGQTFFSSFETSASTYYALGSENRFVLAGKLGAGVLVGGDELSDIPATRRFFLGGGGSVRGYSFQEISPRNADNEETGGRSYVNGSLEVRIAVTDTIGIVPFIDAGSVSTGTTPDFSDIRAGAGIGLRYATPFGPIRLDFAVPLKKYPGGTEYGIYAGIGQSF